MMGQVIALDINLSSGINPSNSNATFLFDNTTGMNGIGILTDRIIIETEEGNVTSYKNPSTPTNYNVYRIELYAKEINTENLITNWSLNTGYENISTNNTDLLFFIAQGTYAWDWYNEEQYYNITDVTFQFLEDEPDLSILNLYARNISFYDNQSLITQVTAECLQDSYTYSSYDYHMPKSSSNISCSAFGYNDIEFTPLTSYPDNSTYYFEPTSLAITFTENTDGYIKTLDSVDAFENISTISFYQRNISEGKVVIEFNPDGSGNFQQLFSYYNDLDTTINEELYVETVDLQQKLKITGETQAIEDARVCAKSGYNNGSTTEWMTTYCDFTDSTGEVLIKVNDGNTYLFCVQADDYETKCELHNIPESNQETITINLIATDTTEGQNTYANTCGTVFNQNKACLITVATYRPYHSICVNVTRINSLGTTSSIACESDSIAEIFSYDINTNSNYTIGIYLDAELMKTYYHIFGEDDSINQVNYRAGNNNGKTIMERIQENKPLLIFMHIIIIILGVLAGFMFDKYFNGYGVYGAGIWFLFVSMGGFYIFYIPTIMIALYFITEKVLPLFQN